MAIRYLSRIVGLSFAALLVMTSQAQAGGMRLGDVLTNTFTSFDSFFPLLSGAAYVLGLLLAIIGIFKFKDHVDNPAQTPLSAGVKRFLAGGMLFSAPFMSTALKGSLMGSSVQVLTAGNRHGNPGGGGMDQMIFDLVVNAARPAEELLITFAWLSAIVLLIVGVVRLTKTAQEGPRGPGGLGTMMTFLASGALFSFGGMMGSFSASLFGTATISTFATISPTVISSAADAARIDAVIEAVMVFVMIVGYIAFIRGWFVLKAFADGNSQGSLAQALTFLFGGALAINLGALVNVLENTVGVNGITFG